MKHKILLLVFVSAFILNAAAQKRSKSITAYAITAVEKGNSKWTEVKLIDLNSGEEIQSVYKSADEIAILNARTLKPVIKKEGLVKEFKLIKTPANNFKIITDKKLNELPLTEINTYTRTEKEVIIRKVRTRMNSNAPFATQSAACAYDKKHGRLYYTPMGINQLRYIDLNSKSPQVFYFENEPMGVLSDPGDAPSHITRMVIGGDGNGYALTNNAQHLIRFTTNKKADITDMGALSDDANNGTNSVHSGSGYGGDMIADRSGNLYLITANRSVFKINIDSRVATFKGSIKGLPQGFTTNGAAVEKNTNVIVTSSTHTSGYYMFDLNTLQAQKISEAESVFNASDLANSNLISDSKIKKEIPQTQKEEAKEFFQSNGRQETPIIAENKMTVFPNPVTNGVVNLSFKEYSSGRYEIQFMDLSGKLIQERAVYLNSKTQVQELKLPASLSKGNYLVKVVNEAGKVINVEKILLQ
ncbi:MAG: T9SS type A sorting domain-containing protein [Ferruginibacter sp.]